MTAIYEVQQYGKTLEWTDSYSEAKDAYKDTSPTYSKESRLYRIVGSKKTLLESK